jgi:hypothetical protein
MCRTIFEIIPACIDDTEHCGRVVPGRILFLFEHSDGALNFNCSNLGVSAIYRMETALINQYEIMSCTQRGCAKQDAIVANSMHLHVRS